MARVAREGFPQPRIWSRTEGAERQLGSRAAWVRAAASLSHSAWAAGPASSQARAMLEAHCKRQRATSPWWMGAWVRGVPGRVGRVWRVCLWTRRPVRTEAMREACSRAWMLQVRRPR